MAGVEIPFVREQLIDRRRRLESAIGSLEETAHLARLLVDVDAALERLGNGAYGLCESCHDPIEPERLAADPLCRVCLDHLPPAERAMLEQDLELAGRVQAGLLPRNDLRTDGWEVCYHYEPAGAVSGDYLDIMERDSAAGMFFLLGDIAGKGVAASLLMSHLRASVRTLLDIGVPLAELVKRANRLFCESTLPAHYATLVCGRADGAGAVEIANAGHCPPLLLRPDGSERIEATGLPLGLFCDGAWRVRSLRMERGDSLVLYTDGLSEARNAAGADYGPERLESLAETGRTHSARALAGACLADVTAFLAGAPKRDDLSLMVIRRAE